MLPREGVSIYYEILGTGPMIFLISAAYGTCEPYGDFARALSRHFTVVSFDRRGYFRSKKLDREANWGYDTLFTENANDTAALIKLISKEPVFVFASSSGCLTAIELLHLYPSLIRKLVLHEPSPCRLFAEENFEIVRPLFQNVVDVHRESGTMAGMKAFLPHSTSDHEREMIRVTPAYASLLALATITHEFFFDYEIEAILHYEVPIPTMKKYREKIALLNSVDSNTPSTKEPIRGLAKKLQLPVTQTEGGHVGYVTHPEEFGQVLMQVIGPALEVSDTKHQMVKSRL